MTISIYRQALIYATLLLTSQSFAHNNYFLPGDSFFSVSLTKKVMAEWQANQTSDFKFDYTRFDGSFMACGSNGFTDLTLKGIPPSFKKSLIAAYKDFALPPEFVEYEDQEQYQTNGVVALIYNSDFEGPWGIKFNEDWMVEGVGVYSGYIDSKNAVAEDWQHAAKYARLKTTGKSLNTFKNFVAEAASNSEAHGELPLFSGIEANAEDLKIVLVGHGTWAGFGTRQTCPNLKSIHDQFENEWSYIVVEPGHYTKHSYSPTFPEEETEKIVLDQ